MSTPDAVHIKHSLGTNCIQYCAVGIKEQLETVGAGSAVATTHCSTLWGKHEAPLQPMSCAPPTPHQTSLGLKHSFPRLRKLPHPTLFPLPTDWCWGLKVWPFSLMRDILSGRPQPQGSSWEHGCYVCCGFPLCPICFPCSFIGLVPKNPQNVLYANLEESVSWGGMQTLPRDPTDFRQGGVTQNGCFLSHFPGCRPRCPLCGFREWIGSSMH